MSGTLAGLCLVYLLPDRIVPIIDAERSGRPFHDLIVVIVLSGLKAYAEILLAFLVGYGITVLGAMQLGEYGLEGLLSGFV